MKRELRAIVVGAGSIGRIHVHALRRNRVEIASLVTSTPDRSIESATELGVPRGDPDLATALEKAEADSVHICATNVHHYPMAKQSLLAGKHVICEKPFTITSDQAAELHALAVESGLVHAICFNNRFYPLVQDIGARMRSGEIGRPFQVRASICDDGLWSDIDGGWRLDPALGGESVAMATTSAWIQSAMLARGEKRARQTSGRFLRVAMPSFALIDWTSIAIRFAATTTHSSR